MSANDTNKGMQTKMLLLPKGDISNENYTAQEKCTREVHKRSKHSK